MRWTVLVAALALAGCLGAEAEPRDQLSGTEWSKTLSTAPLCVRTVSFGEAGEFSTVLGCLQIDGVVTLEAENGSYEVDGMHLTTTMTSTTCADTIKVETVLFEFSPSALGIVGAGGAGITFFERFSPSIGGSDGTHDVIFGCYDDAGAFAPMPPHQI